MVATMAVFAHGSNIKVTEHITYELYGKFEDGQVMKNAQITIFSPEDPKTPHTVATANEEGKYFFIPDPEIQGEWTIQFRTAGHGDMIAIDSSKGAADTSPTIGLLQRIVVGLSVLWGFVGTSLYFKGRAK